MALLAHRSLGHVAFRGLALEGPPEVDSILKPLPTVFEIPPRCLHSRLEARWLNEVALPEPRGRQAVLLSCQDAFRDFLRCQSWNRCCDTLFSAGIEMGISGTGTEVPQCCEVRRDLTCLSKKGLTHNRRCLNYVCLRHFLPSLFAPALFGSRQETMRDKGSPPRSKQVAVHHRDTRFLSAVSDHRHQRVE